MKHGDVYIAKDGRELMVVATPRGQNACAPYDHPICELMTDYGLCLDLPCKGQPFIFVTRQKYLVHKLLGTPKVPS